MSIKLIVFDLDGTLIDSVPDLAQATNQMLNDLGREGVADSSIRQWVGNGADSLVARALSNDIHVSPFLDENLRQQARALFDDHYQRITQKNALVSQTSSQTPQDLFPNVSQTLEILSKQGYTLALLTNKPSQFLPDIIKTYGLSGRFCDVIGGDTFERKKPDPMALNWLCKKHQVSPEQVVMVGDSKHDVATGKAAGAYTFALTYGYNHGEPIEDSNPDKVADDISELIAFIEHI